MLNGFILSLVGVIGCNLWSVWKSKSTDWCIRNNRIARTNTERTLHV